MGFFPFNIWPYTNIHELNLDWILQKVKDNENNIKTLFSEVAEIGGSQVLEPSHVFVVQQNNSKYYNTINEAITEARKVCSASRRALIVVLGGTYWESINLAPNPGIDIIGYNAEVRAPEGTQYPNTALYTCGTGFFSGLSLYATQGSAYSLHYEVQSYEGVVDRATTVFNDCTFNGVSDNGTYSAGIGGGVADKLYFYNCRFESSGSAIYCHNHPTGYSRFDMFFFGCSINGWSGFAFSIDHYETQTFLLATFGCHINGTMTFLDKTTSNQTNYMPSVTNFYSQTGGCDNGLMVPEYSTPVGFGPTFEYSGYTWANTGIKAYQSGTTQIVPDSSISGASSIGVQRNGDILYMYAPGSYGNAFNGTFYIRHV